MEKLTKFSSCFLGLLPLMILVHMLGDIVLVSVAHLSWGFLWDTPYSGGRAGGIFPIIISTFLILGVCLSFVIPVGLASALFLSEYAKRDNRYILVIRKSIEILSAVPSIVFGLFGNAFFSLYLGMGFSILSGGLTLALMSLPLFITTVEKGLEAVPFSYRTVAISLGIGKLTMIKSILIPCAIPALLVGLVLSVGRSLAETAALVFTSGYVDRVPESLFDSGRALSVHIYDLAMNVPGGDINAYKSSFILIVLIVTTNVIINVALINWYHKRGVS